VCAYQQESGYAFEFQCRSGDGKAFNCVYWRAYEYSGHVKN